MEKRLLSGLVLACLMASTSAMAAAPSADSSTINFTGKVVDVPCTLSQDSQNQNIDLGSVASSALASKGATSTEVPVKITLENCSTSTASTASFTFTGTTDAQDSSALENSASGNPATNVGVQMKDATGAIVAFDGTTASGSTTLADEGASVEADFSAYMIAVADAATAGDVAAQTTFTVAYQ